MRKYRERGFMSWITKTLEDIKNNGYTINVEDMNLKDDMGNPIKEMKFGMLTEAEINAIEKHPDIISRRDENAKLRLIGMRIIFERLAKVDKSLVWEEFKMLDQSIIDKFAVKIQEALGDGQKN